MTNTTQFSIFSGIYTGKYTRKGGVKNGSFVADKEVLQIEVLSRGKAYLIESEALTLGSTLFALGDTVAFNAKLSNYGTLKMIAVNVHLSPAGRKPLEDTDVHGLYSGCYSSEEGKSSSHQVYFENPNGAKLILRASLPYGAYYEDLKPFIPCTYELCMTTQNGQDSVYIRSLRPVGAPKPSQCSDLEELDPEDFEDND